MGSQPLRAGIASKNSPGANFRASHGGVRRRDARQLKAIRESDHLIAHRDGRVDHMGKGVTIMRIRQRQPVRGKVGLDQHRPTFLAEISMGCFASSARVSMVEEPGAEKPHAGICAGGAE